VSNADINNNEHLPLVRACIHNGRIGHFFFISDEHKPLGTRQACNGTIQGPTKIL